MQGLLGNHSSSCDIEHTTNADLPWPAAFNEVLDCKQSTKLKEVCVAVQVTLCEQLASYLAKFKPAAQSNAAAASSADVVVPQGMQVLKKKGKPCVRIWDM